MIIKCPISHLNLNSNQEYINTLLNNGNVMSGFLFIHLEKANEIRKQFGMEPKGCCVNSKSQMPSKLQILKNAAGAAGRVIKAVVNNQPILNNGVETQRRMSICKACDQFDNGRCKQCGCYIKFKTALSTETGKCPSGRW